MVGVGGVTGAVAVAGPAVVVAAAGRTAGEGVDVGVGTDALVSGVGADAAPVIPGVVGVGPMPPVAVCPGELVGAFASAFCCRIFCICALCSCAMFWLMHAPDEHVEKQLAALVRLNDEKSDMHAIRHEVPSDSSAMPPQARATGVDSEVTVDAPPVASVNTGCVEPSGSRFVTSVACTPETADALRPDEAEEEAAPVDEELETLLVAIGSADTEAMAAISLL